MPTRPGSLAGCSPRAAQRACPRRAPQCWTELWSRVHSTQAVLRGAAVLPSAAVSPRSPPGPPHCRAWCCSTPSGGHHSPCTQGSCRELGSSGPDSAHPLRVPWAQDRPFRLGWDSPARCRTRAEQGGTCLGGTRPLGRGGRSCLLTGLPGPLTGHGGAPRLGPLLSPREPNSLRDSRGSASPSPSSPPTPPRWAPLSSSEVLTCCFSQPSWGLTDAFPMTTRPAVDGSPSCSTQAQRWTGDPWVLLSQRAAGRKDASLWPHGSAGREPAFGGGGLTGKQIHLCSPLTAGSLPASRPATSRSTSQRPKSPPPPPALRTAPGMHAGLQTLSGHTPLQPETQSGPGPPSGAAMRHGASRSPAETSPLRTASSSQSQTLSRSCGQSPGESRAGRPTE